MADKCHRKDFGCKLNEKKLHTDVLTRVGQSSARRGRACDESIAGMTEVGQTPQPKVGKKKVLAALLGANGSATNSLAI